MLFKSRSSNGIGHISLTDVIGVRFSVAVPYGGHSEKVIMLGCDPEGVGSSPTAHPKSRCSIKEVRIPLSALIGSQRDEMDRSSRPIATANTLRYSVTEEGTHTLVDKSNWLLQESR